MTELAGVSGLAAKQNVFDDFIAAAQWLIDQKYTSSAKLAAMGGSNGGLLMGAFVTQHPGLARAVVSEVGIYDMLRVELDPNGAFNVTEFGTVKDPAEFKALLAMSTYHHIRDGVKYPATLFTHGVNDPRVDGHLARLADGPHRAGLEGAQELRPLLDRHERRALLRNRSVPGRQEVLSRYFRLC